MARALTVAPFVHPPADLDETDTIFWTINRLHNGHVLAAILMGAERLP
jgi:hypothetical protein